MLPEARQLLGWTPNLGEAVNTSADDNILSISHDGQYIFYSTNAVIYSVSAEMLNGLKGEALGFGNTTK